MWEIGNQSVIVLVSVLSGCVILYNIWGSFLGVTISVILVIYACVLLLANGNFPTPHIYFVLEYINQAGCNLYNLLKHISYQTKVNILHLVELAKTYYREHIVPRMDRRQLNTYNISTTSALNNGRRRNTYQLSTEPMVNHHNRDTEFKIGEGLSPITKKARRSYITGSENNSCLSPKSRVHEAIRSFDKVTSTPLIHRDSRNGDINGGLGGTNQIAWKQPSLLYSNDDGETSGYRADESVYLPSSTWGTSISPKMRSRAGGIKTVQTVAGPLLASTRYNIDPQLYADITSPGLTSRLTKYATEANNKLIYQSQYGTGQFPKVNLNSSPTPLLSTKTGRVRTPVTVRIAPPEVSQYSPPDRQKIFTEMCRTENKTSPSVAQVLKEISLKRHASRDDIAAELVKKQRTESLYNSETESFEESTQKRARDESSKSAEEISVDSTALRPTKRTKIPSCFDILNSLSSSTNVTTGVKRKAEISRCGTPDVGKHFKALKSNQRRSTSTSPNRSGEFVMINRELNRSSSGGIVQQKSDDMSPKRLSESVSLNDVSPRKSSPEKIGEKDKKSGDVNYDTVKLTDRLFMRAEPQNIDKLKTLIEEHGNVSAKFTGDGGDEIKKSDIVTMRETSMKARLRSMFDAISGKGSNKIDPKVVIQAEPVNSTESMKNSSSSITALNSTTSTTNINTSPIATSAVVPIIGKSKTTVTPGKHVTFQLTTTPSMATNAGFTSVAPQPSVSVNSLEKVEETKKSEVTLTPASSLSSFKPPSTTIVTPTFNFGVTTANTVTAMSSTITTTSNMTAIVSSPITVSSATSVFNSTASPSLTAGTPVQKVVTTQNYPVQTSSMQSTVMTTPTPANSLFVVSTVATNPIQSTITSTVPSSSANMFAAPASSQSLFPQFTASNSTPSTAPSFSSVPAATVAPIPAKSQGLFAFNSPTTTASVAAKPTATTTNSPLFNFGKNTPSTTAPTTSASTFAFGNNPPASKSSFTFGTTNTAATTSAPPLSFGTPNQTPVVAFGSSSVASAPSVFGSNPTITTASSAFGAIPATTSSAFGSVSTTTTPAFGSIPTTTATSSAFGSIPATTSSAFGSIPATTSSAFGSIPTTTTPVFGSVPTTTASAFGSVPTTTSSAFGSVPTTATSAFGSVPITTASNSTQGSATPFTFNATPQQSAFAPATTTGSISTNNQPTIPQFGAPKTTEAPAFGLNATGNTLNGMTTVASTTTTSVFNAGSSSIFGQSKLPAFGATTTTTFGTNATPTFASSSSTALFGASTTTAGFTATTPITSVTSTPTFGTPSSTAAFGATNSTPSFGNTSASTSAFASPATPIFGSQSSNASGFNNSTVPPAFGTPTTAPPAFGATTPAPPAFGTATSAPPPAFGMAVTTAPPAFGSVTTSTSSFGTSSAFGAPNTAPPAFGSTATSFGSNSTPAATPAASFGGGTFAFGTPQSSQPQQGSLFTFGGSATSTPASGGSTPFQFGGATTPQPGGFNFNGGAPAPTAFAGTSGGGMFSIGSGSTAPRTRTTRPRRQQR